MLVKVNPSCCAVDKVTATFCAAGFDWFIWKLKVREAGFTVTKIHLETTAQIPGADQAAFDKAAQDAKAGCPISRLLKAEITLTAKLVGGRATTA